MILLIPRAESRYTYRAVLGARDGFLGNLAPDYFDAIYDDPLEAKAQFDLYAARARR